ncbi:MAG TPA: DNA recombination/repair protein RecA, partial [Candidatus Cloacimonadota bacterium]|nr:DNA recombination/repair protein RecA [Candidatus Cloacimonadota bacterium]
SGSWFSYGEIRLGQGADKVKIYLKENPELQQQIEEQVRKIITPANFEATRDETSEDSI